MLAFNHLGQNGRLGNQMFQYAGLRGISANRGFDFCIPPSNEKDEYLDHLLLKAFKLKNLDRKNVKYLDNGHIPVIIERRTDFNFDEDLFNNCPDDISINGYFNSEKYFIGIEKSIREDFKFNDEIFDFCFNLISKLDQPISLHVRRSDYLKERPQWVLDENYYSKSLSYFDDNRPILLFSDDKEWCKRQSFYNENRFFISNYNNIIDLCLMSLCSQHIISNSSFAWWGAWLAQSEKVIASKIWKPSCDMITRNWQCI